MAFDIKVKESVRDLKVSSGATTAFLATHLEPQRSRLPAVELQFDRPEKYILDLNDDYPKLAIENAKAIHQRHEDPDPGDPIAEDERPEMAWLANCLHKTLKKLNRTDTAASPSAEPDDDGPFELIESAPSVEDFTKDAKNRRIGVVRLDDPIYQLRYIQQRRPVAAWFMNAAVRRAKARPYFDSALLVSAVITPAIIGGKPNALHKHMSDIVGTGQKEFERSIALAERKMALLYTYALHNDLEATLSDPRVQQALADLFTHSGYDYAGAFYFLTSLIQDLVSEPAECDALAMNVGGAVGGKGRQWLEGLCSQTHSAMLHTLLFPRFTTEDLETPYVPPASPSTNLGNGRFRETDLAALEHLDLPEAKEIRTRDGEELVEVAESDAFATYLTKNMRMGAQVLMGVHGNLLAATYRASQSIISRNSELNQVKQSLESLKAEKAKLENGRWKAQRATTNLIGNAEKLKGIEKALASLNSQKSLLLTKENRIRQQGLQAQMKLYSGSLEQLKRSVPGQLGKMELMRLSKALQKDYFIFEVTDGRQPGWGRAPGMFGDITHGDEVVASTNRSRAKKAKIQIGAAQDVYVIAIPKTEQIVKMIEELGAAEATYVTAMKKLSELEGASDFDLRSPAAAAAASSQLAVAKAELAEAENIFKKYEKNLADNRQQTKAQERLARNAQAANAVDQAKVDNVKSGRIFKALDSPVFPVFVIMLELHNVSNVWISAERDFYNNGAASSVFGVLSTGADFALAGAMLTGLSGKSAAMRLLGPATGFLMAADSYLDAVYEFRMGNNGAGVGHSVVAASGLAFGFASMGGAAGGLLLLGPGGWLAAGAIMAVSGMLAIYAFSDESMDIWMRHGPFGELAVKPLLKEPEEAYSRLISLLMGVTIRQEYNPLRKAALSGELKEPDSERLKALADANERIVIESAIPGLFDASGIVNVRSFLQLTDRKAKITGRSAGITAKQMKGNDLKEYLLLQERTESGVHIYVKTPPNTSVETENWKTSFPEWFISRDRESHNYAWAARIQLHVPTGDNGRQMVFPAPPPESSLTYDKNNTRQAAPDFSSKDQPFWFSEKVYAHE